MVYYKVTWKNWLNGAEQSIVIEAKDVVKFVAILLNSIKPDDIQIRVNGTQQSK